jgi:hypothetical protein
MAVTASYVSPAIVPGLAKAWATCVCTASQTFGGVHTPGVDWHWLDLQSQFNVSSVTKGAADGVPYQNVAQAYPYPTATPTLYPFAGISSQYHWLVTLTNPMPSLNYTVIGGCGGEQNSEYAFLTMFPFAARSTTQFTLSMALGNTNFSNPNHKAWMSFVVFGN